MHCIQVNLFTTETWTGKCNNPFKEQTSWPDLKFVSVENQSLYCWGEEDIYWHEKSWNLSDPVSQALFPLFLKN